MEKTGLLHRMNRVSKAFAIGMFADPSWSALLQEVEDALDSMRGKLE